MQYPHAKREATEYGYSPGNGISPMRLSVEPLASEAEADAQTRDAPQRQPEPATPSLDFMRLASNPDPTSGDDDPYVFDDVADGLGEALPQFSLDVGSGPRF